MATPAITRPRAAPMPPELVVFGAATAEAVGSSVGDGVANGVSLGVGEGVGTGVVTETEFTAVGTGLGVGFAVGTGVTAARARTTMVPRMPSAAHELFGQCTRQ